MFHKSMMLCGTLALAGCAAIQIPPDRFERSEASIRGAEEVGASTVPAAKLHLQLAMDQTQTAKRMAADGDDRAVLVLDRAQADAELALGLARQVAVHNDEMKASEDLKTVKARSTP